MLDTGTIFIATRGSALALAQAKEVEALCRRLFPNRHFELNVIKTTGDKNQAASLSEGKLPKGLFTKELEIALLNGEAHLAVHSLKDLPTALPDGLALGAVLEREDSRDALILRASPKQTALSDLPEVFTVATGSPRRREQLARAHPNWSFVEMRGNVGTRLRKLAEATKFQATVLAMAGMNRLGFSQAEDGSLHGPDVPGGLRLLPLDVNQVVPAVGQAAIGIEIPDHPLSRELCSKLNHPDTWHCVAAERSFLKTMGGGCHLALGAYATLQADQLTLRGISFLSGAPLSAEMSGPRDQGERIGRELAEKLNVKSDPRCSD